MVKKEVENVIYEIITCMIHNMDQMDLGIHKKGDTEKKYPQ